VNYVRGKNDETDDSLNNMLL